MANNEIPKSYEPVVQLLEDAADGAATYGVAINLSQNTEAKIRADLAMLVGTPAGPGGVPPAVPGLKALWNAAKAAKTAATAAFRSAKSNGKALLTACISTLKIPFGIQWNSQWNAVGFTDASLAVPPNPMVKLGQARAFYAANPTREALNVGGTGIDCTAVACEAAYQAISTTESTSNQSNTDAGNAKAALELGISACRNRLIGLKNELDQLLANDDPRWLAFGFDMPGTLSIPEVPANLVFTLGAAGSRQVFFDWDDARRADSYRIVITDAAGNELVNVIVGESEYMATNLPAGATVSATVAGHNLSGDSQPTAPVTVAVP